jgi:hypothetical protein
VKKYLRITIIIAIIISLSILLTQIKSIRDIVYIYKNRNIFYTLKDDDIPPPQILYRCNKLEQCNLEQGDILIRRYITKRVWLLTKITHAHFTHSAIYIGNNKIIEAGGKERDRADDIRTVDINKSDWLQNDIDEIVIFRPISSSRQTINTIDSLTNIANDPDYYFGLHKFDAKRSTCAELIYDQLKSQGLVHNADYYDRVTPDFLFYTLMNNKDKFELIQ